MIVVIVGMHRSGTSAIAGLLHNNGIFMGEKQNFSPGPTLENKKGFFENYRFRSINDKILQLNGYDVSLFNPILPTKIESNPIIDLIVSDIIINYESRHDTWGFKDPRTCLTFDIWQRIFKELTLEPKYILSKRDPAVIAQSMLVRGNEGTFKQFYNLSEAYYAAATEHHKFDFIINFENLIKYTDIAIDRLSEYLDMPIENNGFIEKGLKHQ